ncbi:Hypothetical predicted protein [Podarcis lilfordi]|uniref:Reverse transcriptase RNase H-like domain-containing protein n=1 Tax=Podarcis lilfordi TaxID=74358 RepID=A0AA35PQN8_9SAUR|nr:Hypothetical predicted protein [Podarcis lilfordi]
MGVVHHIDTGDAKPIAVNPHRITGEYVGKVSNEIRAMLKAGIITTSESPWAAPIVLLDKSDGAIRFCLDYRKLNHVTKADAYPMPRLDDLNEAISQCHYMLLAEGGTTRLEVKRLRYWTAACQQAFDALKRALTSNPVLVAPDYDREFTVFTDASNAGIRAVLCQQGEKDDLHPITFISKKLLPRERHYSTIEKECLAIVWALQKLKPYIWGRTFTLCTDHSPLLWLRTMKTNSKLLRWALSLQDFNFTIKNVKGTLNTVTDALSRRPAVES